MIVAVWRDLRVPDMASGSVLGVLAVAPGSDLRVPALTPLSVLRIPALASGSVLGVPALASGSDLGVSALASGSDLKVPILAPGSDPVSLGAVSCHRKRLDLAKTGNGVWSSEWDLLPLSSCPGAEGTPTPSDTPPIMGQRRHWLPVTPPVLGQRGHPLPLTTCLEVEGRSPS